jgi:16S rRNA (cytosine1402-N4)-methyltransferase
MDLDPRALALSRQRLAQYGDRVVLAHSDYADVVQVAKRFGFDAVDGCVLDLGLSSMQLADPARGFSFQEEGPLDMRFDPTSGRTAADVVNTLSVEELAEIIYRYGEEPAARAIARAIVAARPLATTAQLADVVAQAARGRRRPSGRRARAFRHHPATRTFQAIRIAVNHELEFLDQALLAAIDVLGPGGRLAVIAFHSLEDRIVKQTFARESRDCVCPPEVVHCSCGHRASVVRVTRKPVRPTAQEIASNPRSRSARLRVVAKVNAR